MKRSPRTHRLHTAAAPTPRYPRLLPVVLVASAVACGGTVDGDGLDVMTEETEIDGGMEAPYEVTGGSTAVTETGGTGGYAELGGGAEEPYEPEIDGDMPVAVAGQGGTAGD